jgi:hypothetical protein
LRAVPAIELFRHSRFSIDTGAGAGVDILTVEPASNTLLTSALAAPTTRADPIVCAAVTVGFAIASDVALTLTATADVDLASRRYVFADRGQETDILAPWRLRPTLLAGLSFTALGRPQFEPGRPP